MDTGMFREEALLKFPALFFLVSAWALAQAPSPCLSISPEAAKSQFDAVSLKPAEPFKPGTNPFATHGGPGTDDPGRFTMSRAAVSVLISRAYGLDPDQLKGPSWVSDSMNNGFAVAATMPVTTTQQEYCGMLRNMLSGRFHFVFHFEKQSRPGYELTVLPAGPKFKKYVPDAAAPRDRAFRIDENGFPVMPASQPTAMSMSVARTGLWKVSFRNTMGVFARSLASDINQSSGVAAGPGVPLPRVVDKTGLAGVYDIRLEFGGQPFPSSETAGAAAAPDPADAGPNIFTAVQQQLGLKLTKVADVQIDVTIIDRVDRMPTGN
jgi:uncharacterized protein (TIGR03435 family)